MSRFTYKKIRKNRKHKYRMHHPGYEENFPPPYSSASQIEEYLTTIIMLQNKVTRLEDLLERTQQSCDKRIKDSNIYIQQLESTIFNYQNSGGGRVGGRGVAQSPLPGLSAQDIAEMEAEIGSDLDRDTSSDSDYSFGDDLQDNNS